MGVCVAHQHGAQPARAEADARAAARTINLSDAGQARAGGDLLNYKV